MLLLKLNCVHDCHSADLTDGASNRNRRRRKAEKHDQKKGTHRDLPCSSPFICNQKLEHQPVQRQPQDTSDNTAKYRIGKGFRRNHLVKLICPHSDRTHNAVLLCSGRYTGVHAVKNVKHCDKCNYNEKAINKHCACIVGALGLGIGNPLI